MGKCKDCQFVFAEAVDLGTNSGYVRNRCRRYPPVMVDNGGDGNFFFPVVADDDWCGEFRGKGQQQHGSR
jgi:hypothetical protein